jgi:hypothetical protein
MSLSKIAHLESYDAKYYDFICHLKEHLDTYKLFGKYEISKDAQLTTELLNKIEQTYYDECGIPCCFLDRNNTYESQFHMLKELVGTMEQMQIPKHNQISSELMEQMDEANKEVAEIWNSKGVDAAVEHMTRGMREGKMDYATMRSLYG